MSHNLNLTSYSPYSGIEEHCLIEGKSGLLYPGVRIENLSFPLTISALQGAICSCLGNGDTPEKLYQNNQQSDLSEYWVELFELELPPEFPDSYPVFDPLIPQSAVIEEILHTLCNKAITTHSEFPVAALLKTPDGFIPGVNIEVKAWSLGLCAERVAISRAVSAGYSNTDFAGMIIYAPKGDFISPCGACRQVLAEFLPGKQIELHHGDKTVSRHFTSHLLPYGFTTVLPGNKKEVNKSEE